MVGLRVKVSYYIVSPHLAFNLLDAPLSVVQSYYLQMFIVLVKSHLFEMFTDVVSMLIISSMSLVVICVMLIFQVDRGVMSPADISMDISKLVQTLNIVPTSFKDGVKLTLENA